MPARNFLLTVVLLAVPALAGAGDERIYRSLTTEQLEDMLGDQNIQFKKIDSTSRRGIFFYDFKRGAFNVRLTYFDGTDLMLDNVFSKGLSLEKVNEWNKKAKFSRAVLHRDNLGDFVRLEFNLDVVGGITRGTVRQFIVRFEQECASFDAFLANAGQAAGAGGDKIHAQVAPKVIEDVLKGLNLQFEKKDVGKGQTIYEVRKDGTALRIINYDGKDIMIDAVFRKTSLAAINKYNLQRKFIRAVNYSPQGNEYTALEANLDCMAGVTDAMLRHFITAFADDAKHFARYLDDQR